jgi:hypothetical protein
MARFTLRLPDSLHDQVMEMAAQEGVSMNQYIVYALTRQLSAPGYEVRLRSEAERTRDRREMDDLLARLGEDLSADEMQAFVQARKEHQTREKEIV